jgi:hypothetical protein
MCDITHHYYYYYRYSALGPVWAETGAQAGNWYGSGMPHPGQILRGSLPLLSPNTSYARKKLDTGSIRIIVTEVDGEEMKLFVI